MMQIMTPYSNNWRQIDAAVDSGGHSKRPLPWLQIMGYPDYFALTLPTEFVERYFSRN